MLEQVSDTVASLRIGDPMDDASQMGPINSARQYEKVLGYIEAGKKDGARLVTGGRRPTGNELFDRGYWLQPTVFADVDMRMKIAREEIFGPVLSVFRWTEVEDAFTIANGTEYGLTAAIWSHDITTALSAARRVRSGYVWVNSVGAHYPAVPYGGMKSSGVGREEGIEELLSYTETKAVHVALN